MSNKEIAVTANHIGPRVMLASYVIGFILSILLTVGAYALVKLHVAHHHQTPSDMVMHIVLPLLAFIQFFVQLYFFLHLGSERKPRWRLLVFGYMAAVVFILVAGSLWIMYNMNYMTPQLTPQQINTYMLRQNGGI